MVLRQQTYNSNTIVVNVCFVVKLLLDIGVRFVRPENHVN